MDQHCQYCVTRENIAHVRNYLNQSMIVRLAITVNQVLVKHDQLMEEVEMCAQKELIAHGEVVLLRIVPLEHS